MAVHFHCTFHVEQMGRTPIETAPSPEREDVEYSTVCILQLIVAMLAAVLGRLSWKEGGGQDVS